MIRLFTGLPGAGKTLHAVRVALDAIAEGRPVYVANIEGMTIPGAIPLDDPRTWADLPAGALLIVDEAQRFWRATRSLDTPPDILEMETHRHLGIDLLLTTQQPGYLNKHLRGLVGEHTHHLRRTNGTAQTWTWNSVCDYPDILTERDRADVGAFVYPKDLFKLYKSTEKDTHKPGIPRRFKIIGAAAAIIGLAFIFGPDLLKARTVGTNTGHSEASPAQQPTRALAGNVTHKTLEQYLEEQRPRTPAMPWSAPIFDSRAAVANPAIYCMSSGRGIDATGDVSEASATCITEQGSRVYLDITLARRLSETGGTYNPFLQPRIEPAQQGRGRDVDLPSAPSVASSGSTASDPTSYGTIAHYGGLGL